MLYSCGTLSGGGMFTIGGTNVDGGGCDSGKVKVYMDGGKGVRDGEGM